MGTEVMVPGVYVATVVAMTVFLWRVFGKRFDAIDARQEKFEADLERMGSKFDDRFRETESKFDARFREADARFDARFDKVDARLGSLEVTVGKLGGQFDGLRDRFNTLEGKVDGLATDHQRLSNELAGFRGEMQGRLGTLVPQTTGEA